MAKSRSRSPNRRSRRRRNTCDHGRKVTGRKGCKKRPGPKRRSRSRSRSRSPKKKSRSRSRKKRSRSRKKRSGSKKRVNAWAKAIKKARNELGIVGFVKINRGKEGKELYRLAKKIHRR